MIKFGSWRRRVSIRIVARVLLLGFSRNFLYVVVVHMVPPLLHDGDVTNAPWHPIVLGVVMNGWHGLVLGGCRRCTQNTLKFP